MIIKIMMSKLTSFLYYSPELGRFIQPADVSTLNPSSINGLNLYACANNNPIGIAMIVTGSLISFGESVYNNYNNPNYTSNEAGWATLMDFGYYALKGVATYALGSALGNLAVGVGFAVGGILGGGWAVALGIAAAIATYILWEGVDYLYGKIKEWIFE